MTSHVARLYALAAGILVFFVAWAAIAAHPWQTHAAATVTQDPRFAALKLREQRLRAESLAVKRIVDKRWAVYRAQLALRKQEIASINAANAGARAAAASLASAPAAVPSSSTSSTSSVGSSAAPSVRVVTLPPLTITRTS
jgi:hypothetical protein